MYDVTIDVYASGHSYPMSALSSPGGEYMDPLECDSSEINCPACLLQVKCAEVEAIPSAEFYKNLAVLSLKHRTLWMVNIAVG